jgi:putative ubiquitin-RnfH superfamily antitoxin RatB of RatAB toxin-antitoxin module
VVAGLIHIEIVFAQPQQAIVKAMALSQGSRVGDALAAAAGDANFSGVDLANAPVGRDHPLNDGDRLEIYRPLVLEPKAARRARARP